MSATKIVRVRVNTATYLEATAVLSTMGLTASDALRLLLICVAQDKSRAFDILQPNALTIEAMEEARRRSLAGTDSVSGPISASQADD